jgi:hypothetical protein
MNVDPILGGVGVLESQSPNSSRLQGHACISYIRVAGVRLGCGFGDFWSPASIQAYWCFSMNSRLDLKKSGIFTADFDTDLTKTPFPMISWTTSVSCSPMSSAQHFPAAKPIPSPQCTTKSAFMCMCVPHDVHVGVSLSLSLSESQEQNVLSTTQINLAGVPLW